MRSLREEIVVASATGFYTGYIPFASGSFGTVVAVPLCALLSILGPFEGLVLVLAFSAVAVWIAGEAEKIFKAKDSRLIVIDEMAGLLVTLYLVPWSLEALIGGFVVFRFMDILKPFPIRKLESTLPGGWGVVGDDLLAGVYANVVLRVGLQFFA